MAQENTTEPDGVRQDSADSAKDVQEHHHVSYERIGIDIPLNPEDEELYLNAGRIKILENLNIAPKLKLLCLSAQFIEKIQGLEPLGQLEHLELYQNEIEKLENVEHLTKLKVLDVSFNAIRVIENIAALVNLEKLLLSNNKITEMQGLETLTNLRVLELGGNRLRRVRNIESLAQLEQLWLGKNKIETMTLPVLHNLRQLSLQSNRLTDWDDTLFDNVPNLEELYVSHNRLRSIPTAIAKLKKLRVFDIAGNEIENLSSLHENKVLEELWANDNKVAAIEGASVIKDLPLLKTIYLERNPVQDKLGPGYRTALLQLAPHLEQIDAILLRETFKVNVATSK